jgi:hypothetical protein
LTAYEKYLLGVTYNVKDLIVRNRPIVCNAFGIFLDHHFAQMIQNPNLHTPAIDLVRLALEKRAEKADKVIEECPTVNLRLLCGLIQQTMQDMRAKICEKIRSGVKYSAGDENRAMIDECMNKIAQYPSGKSWRRGVKRALDTEESDSEPSIDVWGSVFD